MAKKNGAGRRAADAARRPADTAQPPHPPTATQRVPPSPSRREGPGAELSDFQAGSNRRVQLTATRGRNRFDAAKRKAFLEWFAATCNAKDAARRVGVAYSTVYRTRMLDARFAEAWDRALEQGYARLEAKLLEAMFEDAAGEPIAFDGGFEPDDAPDPRLSDPHMAMQLLRQHRSEVTRIRDERAGDVRARGRTKMMPPSDRPRVASDADVRRALTKRLTAFGVRVSAEDRSAKDRGDEEPDA